MMHRPGAARTLVIGLVAAAAGAGQASASTAPPDTGAPDTGAPPPAVACDEPVRVGLVTDSTGELSIYGQQMLRSVPLGLEYATGAAPASENTYELDGCTIELLIRDDASNPETTATVARELIEVEGVDLLIGTVSSGATASLQELALANDVVLIVAPAAANDITGASFNDHTFRTSRNNYQDAINVCDYLTTQYDSFVQIAPDYAFGQGAAAAFRDACTVAGGTFPVDDIFAPLDTQDFTPYIEQILDSGAEALIPSWPGNPGPLLQAAEDLGVFDSMEIAGGFVDNTLIKVFQTPATIGSVGGILYHWTLPDNEVNDWLTERIVAEGLPSPDIFDADGMNAGIVVVEALRATGGDTSPDALIPALEGMSFDGPKGTIEIRAEDHVAIQDMYVVRLLNLDDPENRFFELIEVNRPEPPCLLPDDLAERCGDLPHGSLGGG